MKRRHRSLKGVVGRNRGSLPIVAVAARALALGQPGAAIDARSERPGAGQLAEAREALLAEAPRAQGKRRARQPQRIGHLEEDGPVLSVQRSGLQRILAKGVDRRREVPRRAEREAAQNDVADDAARQREQRGDRTGAVARLVKQAALVVGQSALRLLGRLQLDRAQRPPRQREQRQVVVVVVVEKGAHAVEDEQRVDAVELQHGDRRGLG
eukprot:4289995-Prymnesium_polylepis.1